MFTLSPLSKRRLANFRANRRALWSLRIFFVLYAISLCAELVANDRPLLISYRGDLFTPVFTFYPETAFGGEFETEPFYDEPEFKCLVHTGGLEDCLYEDPDEVMAEAAGGTYAGEEVVPGWLLWPLIPYSFDTIVDRGGTAPAAPDGQNWLGTDDTSRDVLARVIYGFRISVTFALVTTIVSSLIGVFAGAAQGYFGGWVDLTFQRIEEIWSATPTLYVLIIVSAIVALNFWLIVLLFAIFSWTRLVGVVRAEFLRARNFEYVRAARALGVSDWTIMFRHVLPNAMVATITFMPFIVTGSIGGLATLDFLGLGLPPSYASLGELTLQGKNNLFAPHLAVVAFLTFAVMLSLLVFIFEGVRDAFDPRKVFA